MSVTIYMPQYQLIRSGMSSMSPFLFEYIFINGILDLWELTHDSL